MVGHPCKRVISLCRGHFCRVECCHFSVLPVLSLGDDTANSISACVGHYPYGVTVTPVFKWYTGVWCATGHVSFYRVECSLFSIAPTEWSGLRACLGQDSQSVQFVGTFQFRIPSTFSGSIRIPSLVTMRPNIFTSLHKKRSFFSLSVSEYIIISSKYTSMKIPMYIPNMWFMSACCAGYVLRDHPYLFIGVLPVDGRSVWLSSYPPQDSFHIRHRR